MDIKKEVIHVLPFGLYFASTLEYISKNKKLSHSINAINNIMTNNIFEGSIFKTSFLSANNERIEAHVYFSEKFIALFEFQHGENKNDFKHSKNTVFVKLKNDKNRDELISHGELIYINNKFPVFNKKYQYTFEIMERLIDRIEDN